MWVFISTNSLPRAFFRLEALGLVRNGGVRLQKRVRAVGGCVVGFDRPLGREGRKVFPDLPTTTTNTTTNLMFRFIIIIMSSTTIIILFVMIIVSSSVVAIGIAMFAIAMIIVSMVCIRRTTSRFSFIVFTIDVVTTISTRIY